MTTTIYGLRTFGGVLIIQSTQSAPAPVPTVTVIVYARDGIVATKTRDGITQARTP